MDLTVVLCTFNRSALLAKTLASVAAQELPGIVSWEILISTITHLTRLAT
jgi:glycosyltransferase involved in cell wall biosynthesis